MAFQGDSIFWVDTEKVVPNPFQPRREFDQSKLQELSESIRMYGVLQPLTVTRKEVQQDDGTFYTEYELIAGERRLRASRLAQVAQVPVIIREGDQSEQEKLELAIIENLQREDLNAIDRALAFQQLADQFKLSHAQVAQKVGRSREYVSNSIRLLALPEHMRGALQRGELGEGHARTLLMLTDRPEEQDTIFREILLKKMSVREVERIVRKIATDKVRKRQQHDIDDHLIEIEKEFTETLGTRVQILKTEFGGKLTIDYFSEEDLSAILDKMKAEGKSAVVIQNPSSAGAMAAVVAATPLQAAVDTPRSADPADYSPSTAQASPAPTTMTSATEVAPVAPKQQAPAEPGLEPEPQYQAPAPVMHNGSDSDTLVTQTSDSVAPTEYQQQPQVQPTSNQESASPQPAADPSLLERLAAHTAFSFPRPESRHVAPPQPAPAQPDHSPEPVTQPVQPQSNFASEPIQEQPAPAIHPEPQPSAQTESDDDDLYSVRNFTV